MIRKVRASREEESPSPSKFSESSSKVNSLRSAFEARDSQEGDLLVDEGEDTESLFTERRSPEGGDPEVDQPVHEGVLPNVVDPEALLPGREGYEVRFNSEEYFRHKMYHMRFAINQEFTIALTQLNPNGWRVVIGMYALWRGLGFPALTVREIRHCYSFRSHRTGGDGKWSLASYDKQLGELLITELPSSNKEWKKSCVVRTRFLGGAFGGGAGSHFEGVVCTTVGEAY
ncbi:hypothetical protein LWI28_013443 [Acer negundo]|uniref:Uncharacterized protein n=1 Tax=Acer negundo TaxID=4023 RepID=A0AAD5JHR8_ACENE|nr:hypothetical protein LWI28_013443 [Acer negundo]